MSAAEYVPSVEDVRAALVLFDYKMCPPRAEHGTVDYCLTHDQGRYWCAEDQADIFARIAEHDAEVRAKEIEAAIAEADESPAVMWAGNGGAKSVLRARAARIRDEVGK